MEMVDVDALVSKQDVLDAYDTLKTIVKHTPLEKDYYLSQKYDCNVYLKREDLQWVRSFKLRGAYYAIAQLNKEQLKNGVTCASAGNHAQGVAFTCQKLGVPATIFMPTTTPQQKVSQVRFFGGDFVEVRLTGDTFDASAYSAKKFSAEQNKAFIAPFDDADIIAGQGTVAVEMLDDLGSEACDFVFAAIGGGGLVSGVASYVKAVRPETTIIGVEPAGAPSMAKSLLAGKVVNLPKIDKFVDGAAVKQVGQLTYNHCAKLVDEVTEVDEAKCALPS